MKRSARSSNGSRAGSSLDSTICYRCLTDPVLREIVKESADQSECSFCDRPRRKNVAIDFNVVMERIGETVRQYFGTVDDEGLWLGQGR